MRVKSNSHSDASQITDLLKTLSPSRRELACTLHCLLCQKTRLSLFLFSIKSYHPYIVTKRCNFLLYQSPKFNFCHVVPQSKYNNYNNKKI